MITDDIIQELMPYVRDDKRVEFSKTIRKHGGRWNKEIKIHVSRQEIVDIVCRELNTTLDKMLCKTRVREIAQARQLYVYLMKGCNPNISYESIVAIFNQDHATALHSVKVIKNLYDTNKHWRQSVNRIAEELNSDTLYKFIADKQHLVR
mgnify:CR=1 FL=1